MKPNEVVQGMIAELKLEAFWSAVLEVLRLGAIAAGSWICTEGITILVEYISKRPIDPSLKLLLSGALFAFGKAADKGIHEYGKLTNNETLVTGITRF